MLSFNVVFTWERSHLPIDVPNLCVRSEDVGDVRRIRVGADGAVVPAGHRPIEEAPAEVFNQSLQCTG